MSAKISSHADLGQAIVRLVVVSLESFKPLSPIDKLVLDVFEVRVECCRISLQLRDRFGTLEGLDSDCVRCVSKLKSAPVHVF